MKRREANTQKREKEKERERSRGTGTRTRWQMFLNDIYMSECNV